MDRDIPQTPYQVTTQVMLGDIQTACDLLQLLPQPPQELIFLLKNMPLYQPVCTPVTMCII